MAKKAFIDNREVLLNPLEQVGFDNFLLWFRRRFGAEINLFVCSHVETGGLYLVRSRWGDEEMPEPEQIIFDAAEYIRHAEKTIADS